MSSSWQTVPLGEVLRERQEVPPLAALAGGEMRILAKIGFDDGRIRLRSDGGTRTGMILIRPGDLVVSGINAAKGAIAIFGEESIEPIAATIHYVAYIPNKERVENRYLWWLLRSATFRGLLLEHVPGGIKTELKAKRLLPIPVPLPPLSEQQRIVARIEDLAAKIEEARGLRIRSQAEVDEVYDAECRTLFESNDWEFKSVEKAVGRENLRNGKSVKSSEHPDGVRCLRLSAMQSGRLVCEEAKPVPLSLEEAHDYLIHERDVFVIRGNGSKELVGRAAMAEQSDNRTIFPDLFIRVALADSGWTPEFFVAYWNSPIIRAVLTDAAKTTSGIWKVNQGHIGSCKIPVPPHEEQVRIVAHLDGVKAKLDSLKNLLAETSAELEAMLPSILDKAFKGNI